MAGKKQKQNEPEQLAGHNWRCQECRKAVVAVVVVVGWLLRSFGSTVSAATGRLFGTARHFDYCLQSGRVVVVVVVTAAAVAAVAGPTAVAGRSGSMDYWGRRWHNWPLLIAGPQAAVVAASAESAGPFVVVAQ